MEKELSKPDTRQGIRGESPSFPPVLTHPQQQKIPEAEKLKELSEIYRRHIKKKGQVNCLKLLLII